LRRPLELPTYLRHIENKQERTLLPRYAIRHTSQKHTIPFSPCKQPKAGAGKIVKAGPPLKNKKNGPLSMAFTFHPAMATFAVMVNMGLGISLFLMRLACIISL